MSRKKISTTVYLTAEQHDQLRAVNAHTKVPIAELIRQGIDLALERHKSALPGQIDLFAGSAAPSRPATTPPRPEPPAFVPPAMAARAAPAFDVDCRMGVPPSPLPVPEGLTAETADGLRRQAADLERRQERRAKGGRR